MLTAMRKGRNNLFLNISFRESSMTSEQRTSLILLLRQFVNLMQENSCMAVILDKSEIIGSPVGDWQSEVERLRQLPSRSNALVRSLRDLIDKFERDADENDLIELATRITKGNQTRSREPALNEIVSTRPVDQKLNNCFRHSGLYLGAPRGVVDTGRKARFTFSLRICVDDRLG